MFDLDEIERDWKINSFSLSEEEIMEIYRVEGITRKKYSEELDEYQRTMRININISAEERLLASIFNDKEIIKKIELKEKLREEHKFPAKRRLSEIAQRKVVEGCLHLVFQSTREWYSFFDGKISIERIYYICLESLMNTVKYTLHPEKKVFRFYVMRNIEKNIIQFIARREHITYKEAYRIINNLDCDGNPLWRSDRKSELSSDCENEEPKKMSEILYLLRKTSYSVDYIKNVSSEEFMRDYYSALDSLDELERIVMGLSFDNSGNRAFSSKDIGDYLGINAKKVSNIRRRAIKTLRKNELFNKYKS